MMNKKGLKDKLLDSLGILSDKDELIIRHFKMAYSGASYITPPKIGKNIMVVSAYLDKVIKHLSKEIGCEYHEVTTRMKELDLIR
jgi:hypothetical protein